MAEDPPAGNVLIVEDQPRVREVVAKMLAARCPGAEIWTAKDAQEGLALLAKHRFDVMLVDYHLPDMSGLDLAQRAKEEQPHLRSAMMTGEPEEGLAVAANRHAGVERFFVKPLDFESFTRAVAGMLRATAQRGSSSPGSSPPIRPA